MVANTVATAKVPTCRAARRDRARGQRDMGRRRSTSCDYRDAPRAL